MSNNSLKEHQVRGQTINNKQPRYLCRSRVIAHRPCHCFPASVSSRTRAVEVVKGSHSDIINSSNPKTTNFELINVTNRIK